MIAGHASPLKTRHREDRPSQILDASGVVVVDHLRLDLAEKIVSALSGNLPVIRLDKLLQNKHKIPVMKTPEPTENRWTLPKTTS